MVKYRNIVNGYGFGSGMGKHAVFGEPIILCAAPCLFVRY